MACDFSVLQDREIPLAGVRGSGLLGPPGPACLGLWAWGSPHTRRGPDALLQRDQRRGRRCMGIGGHLMGRRS